MDPRIALCLVLICIAPGVYSQGNCLCARGFCDEGWVQYKDSCYKAVMKPTKWAEAEVACQSQGKNSHLASIHSAEENDFIFHLMGKLQDYTKGQAYWIGGHDTFKEGSFMWTDGSEYDFHTFPPGQPDGLPGENYLGSWILQNDSGQYQMPPSEETQQASSPGMIMAPRGPSRSFANTACRTALLPAAAGSSDNRKWGKTQPVSCGGGCVTFLPWSCTSGTIYCCARIPSGVLDKEQGSGLAGNLEQLGEMIHFRVSRNKVLEKGPLRMESQWAQRTFCFDFGCLQSRPVGLFSVPGRALLAGQVGSSQTFQPFPFLSSLDLLSVLTDAM